MKILLISGKFLPIYNKGNRGAIQSLERTYLEFNEKIGDSFTVYSPKISANNYDSKKLRNTTFRSVDLTTKRAKILKKFYSIKNIIEGTGNNEFYIREIIKDVRKRNEENKYDLIIFENEEGSIPIFKKKTHTETPIVLHLHNDYINKGREYSKKILANCEKVWCVSHFIENRVKEVGKVKTAVIPNTYEKLPKPNQEAVKSLKKRYNHDKNNIFLYIGRLLEVKGLRELIVAFNQYNSMHPNSKLIIIGDFGTSRKERAFANYLHKQFKKNPNIEPVGYKSHSEIADYYSIAKAQIIPTKCNEAFGLVVLEAMQASMRIIASGFGAFKELCGNKIVYVSRQNMVDDLVKAMDTVAKAKPLPKEYYRDILCKYNKEEFCNRMLKEIHREQNK